MNRENFTCGKLDGFAYLYMEFAIFGDLLIVSNVRTKLLGTKYMLMGEDLNHRIICSEIGSKSATMFTTQGGEIL